VGVGVGIKYCPLAWAAALGIIGNGVCVVAMACVLCIMPWHCTLVWGIKFCATCCYMVVALCAGVVLFFAVLCIVQHILFAPRVIKEENFMCRPWSVAMKGWHLEVTSR